LSIDPNKKVVIYFTRRRNIKCLREPILFGRKIQLSSEVKCLRITPDKGLAWKKQVYKVINKAYRNFWACRGPFGKTWGLKPKVIYWINTAVVRPIVTYAATVWWLRVKYKTSQAELSKLQTVAWLGSTDAIKTALTAAMEVQLVLHPLHLQVEAEVILGNYRLRCNEQ
jgi:hypothetical protein